MPGNSSPTGILSDIVGTIGTLGAMFSPDWWKAQTGSGLTTAQIEQNNFNADQARLAWERNEMSAQEQRDWQTEMDNTRVQRSVADMQAAGVNPAMMMGGSGATASAPSGAAASGPAASGSHGQQVANMDAILNMMMIGQRFKESQAQIGVLKSQADKNDAEAEFYRDTSVGLKIDNDYKEQFKQLELQGIQLSNKLLDKQSEEIEHRIKEIDVRSALEQSQIGTEITKQDLNFANAIKSRMDAKVAADLLPFQESLMQAQTENQKAQASYALVQAAIQKGLMDDGYFKSMADEAGASAGYAKFMTAVKTGDPNGEVYDGKFARFIGRTAAACGALIEASGIKGIFSSSTSFSTSTSNSTSTSFIHKN